MSQNQPVQLYTPWGQPTPQAQAQAIQRLDSGGSKVIPQDTNNIAGNLNQFGFSLRLMEDLPISADYWQALAVLFLMWKDRPMLERIIKDYFKVLSETMGHLAQAATGNLITAWTHPILIANILEHNYMIASGAAGGMEQSTQWIAGALTGSSVLSAIFGGRGFDVPSTIIYATSGHEERMEMLQRMRPRSTEDKDKKKANPNAPHLGTNVNLDGTPVKSPSYDVT
jgi:hypothetical protein